MNDYVLLFAMSVLSTGGGFVLGASLIKGSLVGFVVAVMLLGLTVACAAAVIA